jgi:uncharacterized integral membrane protein
MMLVLLGGFYATMVVGGFLVEGIFHVAHLVPDNSSVRVAEQGITWNYTTILDILGFVLTGVLVVRFVRTGGRAMLAMMGGSPDDMSGHH